MSRSRGFTLCELMVVLAIVSIMAAVGTISLLGMKQRMKLTGLANTIKGDLNRGKIIAARQKSYVVLQINDGFYELFVDNGAGGATPGDWLRQGDEIRLARREIEPVPEPGFEFSRRSSSSAQQRAHQAGPLYDQRVRRQADGGGGQCGGPDQA